jgi:predicted nuclease with TOPRIM domain
MTSNPYQDTFEAALEELSLLISEREELDAKRNVLDTRIYKLREAVMGLGSLCDKSPDAISREWPELFPDRIPPDIGLTDAVREIFKAYPNSYLSPVFIRDGMKTLGFELSKYNNVLASIHTTVKRLREQGEVVESNRDGRVVYKQRGNQGSADEDVPF